MYISYICRPIIHLQLTHVDSHSLVHSIHLALHSSLYHLLFLTWLVYSSSDCQPRQRLMLRIYDPAMKTGLSLAKVHGTKLRNMAIKERENTTECTHTHTHKHIHRTHTRKWLYTHTHTHQCLYRQWLIKALSGQLLRSLDRNVCVCVCLCVYMWRIRSISILKLLLLAENWSGLFYYNMPLQVLPTLARVNIIFNVVFSVWDHWLYFILYRIH